MKKELKIVILSIVILIVSVIGCVYLQTKNKEEKNDFQETIADQIETDDDDPIKNYQYINLSIGQTTKISYDFLAEKLTKVNFTSANQEIATVDNEGNVTALAVGSTTITLDYTGGTIEFYVSVDDSYSSNASTTETKIHFISLHRPDTGEFKASDAILLESNGKYALIDAGYSATRNSLYSYLMQFATNGVLKLEFVLITHNHTDHIGALTYLLQKDNIIVKTLYINKYYKNDIMTKYMGGSKQENYAIYNSQKNKEYVINNQTRYNNVITLMKQRHESDSSNFNIYYLSGADDARKSSGGLRTLDFGNYTIRLYNTKQQLKSSKMDYNGFDSGNCLNDYCRNADGNVNSVVAKVTSNVNGVIHTTLLTGDLNYPLLQGITKSAGKVDVFKMPHHGVYATNNRKGLTSTVIRNSLKNSIGSNTIVVVTAAKSKFTNRSILGMLYVSKTLGRPMYYTGGNSGPDGKTIVINYARSNLSVEYN